VRVIDSSEPVSIEGAVDISAGACKIPDVDKVEKLGEDAYYMSPNGRILAVADGVGGYNEIGIDPAPFATGLMASVGRFAMDAIVARSPLSALSLMSHAYRRVLNLHIKGGSTACVLVIAPGKISSANLGDGRFVIVRNNQVVYRSKRQQSEFNAPLQLASTGFIGNDPTEADVRCIADVESGDVVVLGTDGLFDNLFDADIIKVVSSSGQQAHPKDIAERLARKAYDVSFSEADSPFALEARRSGLPRFKSFRGGKPDDIAVVVARM